MKKYKNKTGAIPGFQVREGGAQIFGVFRVKNLDFTRD
jgi:hypothetical protein